MLPVPLHPAYRNSIAVALVALQRTAYAVEAALIGSDSIPGLRDTPCRLVAAGLTWFGICDGEGLLGAVAVTDGPDGVDIDRLVVAPHAFHRGIGTALVQHILTTAAGRTVTVSTGRPNARARALYARLCFVETGESEVEPGLWVTHYAVPAADC